MKDDKELEKAIESTTSSVSELKLSHQPVEYDFEPLLQEYRASKPLLKSRPALERFISNLEVKNFIDRVDANDPQVIQTLKSDTNLDLANELYELITLIAEIRSSQESRAVLTRAKAGDFSSFSKSEGSSSQKTTAISELMEVVSLEINLSVLERTNAEKLKTYDSVFKLLPPKKRQELMESTKKEAEQKNASFDKIRNEIQFKRDNLQYKPNPVPNNRSEIQPK